MSGSMIKDMMISNMAKTSGNSKKELRKSVEDFKDMTPAQRRSYQNKKNLNGDKMSKIIEEYTHIQNNLKDLSRNFKADVDSPKN
jgi:hypothetical protein